MSAYKMGDKVIYEDGTKDGDVTRTGTVNGDPIVTEHGTYVPVWTVYEEPHRAPNNVYVFEGNIRESVPPRA